MLSHNPAAEAHLLRAASHSGRNNCPPLSLFFASAVFFCGFRPKINWSLREFWNFNFPLLGISVDPGRPYEYMVWESKHWRDGGDVMMPVAPWQVALVLLEAFGLYEYGALIATFLIENIAVFGEITVLIAFIALFIGMKGYNWTGLYYRLFNKEGDEEFEVRCRREEKKRAKELAAYREWLSEVSTAKVTATANPAMAPNPFGDSKIVKFRIALQTLKAKVCKPFAR